ncbi:hypothetical protein CAPTEDRAFT_211108 [Capitella teleta]|uniref:Uncharacterized protein n=1 Tax=Capitella teleta TaxID=283909 RepID=R7TNM5_CAPTE|nr:hypothetical protein CAPTEDRAFT_211108 [Capitella teleta]|eukprot:ELT95239.1 hypothetical protein CAPTEDRAFT_211108 [Capitella teleta]
MALGLASNLSSVAVQCLGRTTESTYSLRNVLAASETQDLLDLDLEADRVMATTRRANYSANLAAAADDDLAVSQDIDVVGTSVVARLGGDGAAESICTLGGYNGLHMPINVSGSPIVGAQRNTRVNWALLNSFSLFMSMPGIYTPTPGSALFGALQSAFKSRQVVPVDRLKVALTPHVETINECNEEKEEDEGFSAKHTGNESFKKKSE